MSESNQHNLTIDDGGERLDKYLALALSDLSRAEAQRLIKEGAVQVNGKAAKASYRLEAGDNVSVELPAEESDEVLPEDIPLSVLYEDTDLIAIDKPADMVVHPAYGNPSGTLVNALLHHYPEVANVGSRDRAGIVHRLDKQTSGVMVVARTQSALEALQAQFKARTVEKHYIALVEGTPDNHIGIIEAPIGRDPKQRKRMAVVRGGRPARTRYQMREAYDHHSLLDLWLETGRTHQIRVHLAWLKHPVVGDQVYGFRKQRIKLNRLFLHAADLAVDSPTTGERLNFSAPLPEILQNVLTNLSNPRR